MNARTLFGDSGSETDAPPDLATRKRKRAAAGPDRENRLLRLELAVADAKLKLLEAQLADARDEPLSETRCPLTLTPVRLLRAPVAVGSWIVDVEALVPFLAHANPSANPANPSTLRVPHFHAPNDYATVGYAVRVVTEAEQKMYGARPTPLGPTDRSAVDMVTRLLKRHTRDNQLRDSDSDTL